MVIFYFIVFGEVVRVVMRVRWLVVFVVVFVGIIVVLGVFVVGNDVVRFFL